MTGPPYIWRTSTAIERASEHKERRKQKHKADDVIGTLLNVRQICRPELVSETKAHKKEVRISRESLVVLGITKTKSFQEDTD